MTEDIRISPIETVPTGDPKFDELSVRADPELIAAGWTRRSVVDPQRAEELVALYTELGFETMSRTLKPEDFSAQCGLCAEDACRMYLMIYTRQQTSTPTNAPEVRD